MNDTKIKLSVGAIILASILGLAKAIAAYKKTHISVYIPN